MASDSEDSRQGCCLRLLPQAGTGARQPSGSCCAMANERDRKCSSWAGAEPRPSRRTAVGLRGKGPSQAPTQAPTSTAEPELRRPRESLSLSAAPQHCIPARWPQGPLGSAGPSLSRTRRDPSIQVRSSS
eukprot:2070723-Rhodomonas_salina.1